MWNDFFWETLIIFPFSTKKGIFLELFVSWLNKSNYGYVDWKRQNNYCCLSFADDDEAGGNDAVGRMEEDGDVIDLAEYSHHLH